MNSTILCNILGPQYIIPQRCATLGYTYCRKHLQLSSQIAISIAFSRYKVPYYMSFETIDICKLLQLQILMIVVL